VTSGLGKPIYSSRSEELELREAIDQFAIGLAERVDQLQDADFNRDWESLTTQSQKLIADAKRVGFDPLSRCAEDVVESCESADAERIHTCLCELTDVAKRIRMGHRGAV